jgi:hypothetical protein
MPHIYITKSLGLTYSEIVPTSSPSNQKTKANIPFKIVPKVQSRIVVLGH